MLHTKSGGKSLRSSLVYPFSLESSCNGLSLLATARGRKHCVFFSAGIVLIILGAVLLILARRQFRRYGQPTDPGHPTHKVVTTGVFSISRNPLYLGGIGILVGLALAFNLPWAIVLLLPAFVACHYILMSPEERYLTEKFGEAYRSYVEKVDRWIGRKT